MPVAFTLCMEVSNYVIRQHQVSRARLSSYLSDKQGDVKCICLHTYIVIIRNVLYNNEMIRGLYISLSLRADEQAYVPTYLCTSLHNTFKSNIYIRNAMPRRLPVASLPNRNATPENKPLPMPIQSSGPRITYIQIISRVRPSFFGCQAVCYVVWCLKISKGRIFILT